MKLRNLLILLWACSLVSGCYSLPMHWGASGHTDGAQSELVLDALWTYDVEIRETFANPEQLEDAIQESLDRNRIEARNRRTINDDYNLLVSVSARHFRINTGHLVMVMLTGFSFGVIPMVSPACEIQHVFQVRLPDNRVYVFRYRSLYYYFGNNLDTNSMRPSIQNVQSDIAATNDVTDLFLKDFQYVVKNNAPATLEELQTTSGTYRMVRLSPDEETIVLPNGQSVTLEGSIVNRKKLREIIPLYDDFKGRTQRSDKRLD